MTYHSLTSFKQHMSVLSGVEFKGTAVTASLMLMADCLPLDSPLSSTSAFCPPPLILFGITCLKQGHKYHIRISYLKNGDNSTNALSQQPHHETQHFNAPSSLPDTRITRMVTTQPTLYLNSNIMNHSTPTPLQAPDIIPYVLYTETNLSRSNKFVTDIKVTK